MATSSNKPSAEMANTIVSYAQAAKGHNAPPAQHNPHPVSSPALSSQTKEDTPTTNPASTAASSVATNEIEPREPTRTSQHEVDAVTPKQDTTEVSSLSGTASSTGSSSERTAKQYVDIEASVPEPQRPDDKGRSSSRTSQSNDGLDTKKGKKGKKGRGADKDVDTEKSQEAEKEVPKLVLTEAKPPPVNPWKQRAEAQQAKGKVTPVSSPSTTQNTFSPPGAAVAAKKRATMDEAETSEPTSNGLHSDKMSRKVAEPSRAPDQTARRNGSRGGRVTDKDEKSNGFAVDTSSWPDPKSSGAAREEEKRKALEKLERGEKDGMAEADPVKAPKQKWEKVDFVPTVAFATPLPQRNSKPRGNGRGGREAGAGRGGHGNASTGSVAGSAPEKGSPASGPGPSKPVESHQREGSISNRGASIPPTATKRMSIDTLHPRDQRKVSVTTSSERPSKDTNFDAQTAADGKNEGSRPARGEYGQVNPEAPSFPARNDRRGEFPRDQPHQGSGQPSFPPREGRADRGRGGGYRRGGHNGPAGSHTPQSAYPNANTQYGGPVPFPGRQNGPYSPPPFQTTFATTFGPSTGRGGRGTGRGNSSVSGRSSSNGHGYPPKMPQFNPNSHYDYNMLQYGSSYNYSVPNYEPSLLQIAQAQVEYYVSIDNLCKDRFLRSHMDGDGWVDINVIAHFKRMLDLTKGDREIVRTACLMSDRVEVVVGEDGVERLRAREHWRSFILPEADRVPEARGTPPQTLYPVPRLPVGVPYPSHMMPSAFTPTSPTGFALGYSMEEQMFSQGYMNGGHYEPPVNGVNMNGHPYSEASQLSATVPEFSPNGTSPPLTLESMTNFADAKVEQLMMLVEPSKKISSPGHQCPNGTAVNCTDDQTLVSDKAGHVERTESTSLGENSEPYIAFRSKALEERKKAKPGETTWLMRQLYEFWAWFLVSNFNANMYDEFRTMAIEDANRQVPSKTGLKSLLQYYNRLFYGEQPKPWGPDRPAPEIFTLHYQEADGLNQGVNGDARA